MADKLFKHLEEVNTAVQVKGRGYHSKAGLDKCKDECEEIFKHDREIEAAVKALKPLQSISPVI